MMTRILTVLILLGRLGLAGPEAAQAPSGTFQLGDRVWLQVEGEQQLSDTFSVGPGLVLNLPVVGEISLTGVARAQIEAHLARELGRFLRNPVVRARALVRIAIAGEVARPGFYAVPTDLVLPDAVMLAGGATPAAKLDAIRVERGDRRLWAPDALERAVAQGLTLDDLELRTGDRIVVPRQGGGFVGTVQVLGILVTIPAAIYGLTQIF